MTATPMSQVVKFGRMIKFEHTVFALPFALAAAAIAARGHGLSIARVAGIVVAMAGARTAAMGFNRIVDRHIDAKNPRTAGRELPTGAISLRAWALTITASIVFCRRRGPRPLPRLAGRSRSCSATARPSVCALCLFLGLAIAGGPAGARIADFGWAPGLLMLAVGCWIAGFDILYALSDRDFDRASGLHSIPARLGVAGALVVSALLHAVTVAALFALAPAAGLGLPYLIGVAVVTALLVYEHAIVRPSDLSRLDIAFFNLNGYVSVAFFVATLIDVLVA
jgi:4-hydroxybenzoate polyprenyltransferase